MPPSLADRVAALDWYHTFELPGGVVTPGIFDHRSMAAKVPFPDLSGKRCLDVASSDGFWAFEMSRRGAAEVVSVDLDDASLQDWQGPLSREHSAGTGRARAAFELVREATGLDIERRDGSVYDLDPGDLGVFDFVFMGNVLLHLSDPARALRGVHRVTSGSFLSLEMVLLWLSISRPRSPSARLSQAEEGTWWTPNMAAHRQLMRAAGFAVERAGGPLLQPMGHHLDAWPKDLTSVRTFGVRASLAYWLFIRRFGAPTSWVLATPIP